MRFSKNVTKTLDIRVDPVDGFALIRAKWSEAEDKTAYVAVMRSEDVLLFIEGMDKPEDIQNARLTLPGGQTAHAVLVKGDARTDRLAYETDPYLRVSGMTAEVPDGAKVVFIEMDRNAQYDRDGNLLNGYYADSVCADQYDLEGLIALADAVDWLTVPVAYGRQIYTVPGNGPTINLQFTVAPEEYQALLDDRSYNRVSTLLRAKGLDPKAFAAKTSDEDRFEM